MLSFFPTPSAERNLVTIAPRSESEMDYFIMGVYLAAALGLYGSWWTLASFIWLRAKVEPLNTGHVCYCCRGHSLSVFVSTLLEEGLIRK